MYPRESDETWRRETEALVRMNKHLPCSTLLLLTQNEEDTIAIDDVIIQLKPVWKWLLN
jgi:predicted AAA+ superfamily ATPase